MREVSFAGPSVPKLTVVQLFLRSAAAAWTPLGDAARDGASCGCFSGSVLAGCCEE